MVPAEGLASKLIREIRIRREWRVYPQRAHFSTAGRGLSVLQAPASAVVDCFDARSPRPFSSPVVAKRSAAICRSQHFGKRKSLTAILLNHLRHLHHLAAFFPPATMK